VRERDSLCVFESVACQNVRKTSNERKVVYKIGRERENKIS
jgi:hypothetical protein